MTNLRNAHTLLQKMQTLLEQMEEHPGLYTRLERDLMLSYSRRLYEHFLELPISANLPPMQSEADLAPTVIAEPEVEIHAQLEQAAPEVALSEPQPALAQPAPVFEPVEEPAEEQEAEVIAVGENQIPLPLQTKKPEIFSFEPIEVPVQEEAVQEVPAPPVMPAPQSSLPLILEEPVITPVREPELVEAEEVKELPELHFYPALHAELFELPEGGQLVEKFNNIPVPDLGKAWGLNDRLMIINNLFEGSVQAYDTTLNALNQLRNFEEAKQFLSQYVIDKYGWTDRARLEKVRSFLKVVKRKYL